MVATGKRLGDPKIYAVGKEYLARGWQTDDSVFTPGHRVWTLDAFDELHRDFVEHPDESGSGFETKLKGQLAGSTDVAKQLMAELLSFHLLVTRMITGHKKEQIVNTALGWMNQPAPLPSSVREAFDLGFINPGTYFNTGRPIQIQYLIEVGRRWKGLPEATRTEGLGDPWKFKELLGDLHGTGAGSQRHALLHLLFPATFEAIVSDDHMKRIIKHFSYVLTGQTVDLDRQLQEIRQVLTPKYGEDFDFYDPRLRPLWEQGIDPWADLVKWAARLHGSPYFDADERTYKLAAVERVPALVEALSQNRQWVEEVGGAIKNSHNNLTDWRVNDDFIKWVGEYPDEAAEALRALLVSTGDPATRLQAFATKITSVVSTPGNRAAMGSYLLMGTDPYNLPIYKPGPFRKVHSLVGRTASTGTEGERYVEALAFCDELLEEAAARGLELRDRLDAQSVIWSLAKVKEQSHLLDGWSDDDKRAFFAWREGAAGSPSEDESEDVPTGQPEDDSGDVAPVDWMQWAARETHLPVDYLAELESLLVDKGQIVLYGPPGTGKTYVAQVLAEALCDRDTRRVGLVQFHPSTTYEDFFEGIRPLTNDAGQIEYEVRPGPLARFAAMASERPDKRFVLVIDELNRANLPKVLGELLFLLEYRNRDALTLYRPEVSFRLPDNLWFIATMNTVDRSVAIVDAAMRRRFHFVPFYPDRSPVADVLASICSETEAWVAELVAAVNVELIEDLGSRDHQLGASHFIKAVRTPEGLARVWKYTIEPLIEDQFYGQEDRVAKYRWQKVLRRHAGLIPGAAVKPAELGDDSESTEDEG